MSATCPAPSHHITAAAAGTSMNGRPFLLTVTGAPVITSSVKRSCLHKSSLFGSAPGPVVEYECAHSLVTW